MSNPLWSSLGCVFWSFLSFQVGNWETVLEPSLRVNVSHLFYLTSSWIHKVGDEHNSSSGSCISSGVCFSLSKAKEKAPVSTAPSLMSNRDRSGQTKLDLQRCAAMVLSTDDLTQQDCREAAAPFGFISAVWRNDALLVCGGSRDFVSRSLL